ncbi:hypothetical protein G6011_00523 [Alternaria panax]|uniref:Uncharacterized protein n=1 Tax=Alternaria panax TaxID=48097 RepID=A0AAD4IID4_9PLEO|nr:hypothetical protein G6011_00523 [Alternaria panax]
MKFLCLSIGKRTKKEEKEESFNFLRLRPKERIEPLVTPPATPLTFAPPKRPQSSGSRAEFIASKFTGRLELPSTFYEIAVSGFDRAEILRPLSPHPIESSGAEMSSSASTKREEEGGCTSVSTDFGLWCHREFAL